MKLSSEALDYLRRQVDLREDETRGVEEMNHEIVQELYRALVILGADHTLLGTVGSWGDSLPDNDVLANLKAWNAASITELRERVTHYEISAPAVAGRKDGE